ncbi:MAG: 30S ribosomal protein S4e [Thermoplasmatota archaeon]
MSLHLKRLAAPKAWHIAKKTSTWVPKPIPGPHAAAASLPLAVVLRDYLHLCDTAREARKLIQDGNVLVDGKPAFSLKQVAGLMDVISIPKNEAYYRVVLDKHGRIVLAEITAAAAQWKLSRIEGKTTIAGGVTQLNLHDGRNVLVKDAKAYRTGDVLKLHLPDQKQIAHFSLAKGAPVLITGGSHISESANVGSVEVTRSPRPNLVHLTAAGGEFTTIKEYVFVVGKEKAEVTLPAEVVS